MNYRKLLVDYGKKLLDKNLVAGTSGNLSIRGEDENTFYITPSGIDYLEITEKDIVRINSKGESLDKFRKPSSEWRMHIEIYKNYPNYNAVVHTHSTIATAFSVSRKKIPLILIEMKPFLGGEINVAPFHEAGSKELAESIIPFLKNSNSCLMANHGVVSCGKDLESAFLSAEYVEDAAKIYYYSLNIGNPKIISD
ncbi:MULTISPECIES: class II aldolase/adducin family protein [Peptoniphilus]|uniref:class II aldolase/adducin family protein n=1 Tax=Peptoniphilus TaxID=162289 RepID=UPI0002889466|nr:MULTISPECIES: class II aldolase/adducin family protein [Peptoniphilus]MDU2115274.1 class II aldolase/adducin family protein [Peptoniphilus lacydonensis]MDU5377936.1 class II aldolase/adducin family protein [Peptoniphilus lacydonensis]MDU5436985.1 class II aldolase/adducin family protein [Peptoniphilus lacydonensis]MDU5595652.1 class II aldolase/adducin family protein [Peptoniphilus rhinitidis]